MTRQKPSDKHAVHDAAPASAKLVLATQALHSPVIAFGTYPALHELQPVLALQSPD